MRLLATAILAALLATAAAPAAAVDQLYGCRAIDGDTLRCGAERIRLRAIHAPELHEPGGPEARARLERMLSSGADLGIVRRGTDRFGRTRADIYIDDRRITQADIGPTGGRGADSVR